MEIVFGSLLSSSHGMPPLHRLSVLLVLFSISSFSPSHAQHRTSMRRKVVTVAQQPRFAQLSGRSQNAKKGIVPTLSGLIKKILPPPPPPPQPPPPPPPQPPPPALASLPALPQLARALRRLAAGCPGRTLAAPARGRGVHAAGPGGTCDHERAHSCARGAGEAYCSFERAY